MYRSCLILALLFAFPAWATPTCTPGQPAIVATSSLCGLARPDGTSITTDANGTFTAAVGPATIPTLFPTFQVSLTLSNDGTSPNTVLDIAAGSAVDSTNTYFMTLGSAITKTTGSFVAGSGNGALDTGTVAASTFYGVLLIQNTTSGATDILFSASPTSPTLPSGYNAVRLLNGFETDGSAHILAFMQYNNCIKLASPTYGTATVGTASSLVNVGVPNGMHLKPLWLVSIGGTGAALRISDPLQTAVAPTTTTPFSASPGFNLLDESLTSGVQNTTGPVVYTNLVGQIRVQATAAATTFSWETEGWCL